MSEERDDPVSVVAEVDMLAGMPPSDVFGITDLAKRWGVSKPSADAVTERPGFQAVVAVKRMNATDTSEGLKYVDRDELIAWEEAELAAGRPLPGAKPTRGPDVRPRRRRGPSPSSEG